MTAFPATWVPEKRRPQPNHCWIHQEKRVNTSTTKVTARCQHSRTWFFARSKTKRYGFRIEEMDWHASTGVVHKHKRSYVRNLTILGVEPTPIPGSSTCLCRYFYLAEMKFAFTSYGVPLGLQAVDLWPERVHLLNQFFAKYRSGDEYDRNAITHVMACTFYFPGEFIKTC
jgi:hypothetical protein